MLKFLEKEKCLTNLKNRCDFSADGERIYLYYSQLSEIKPVQTADNLVFFAGDDLHTGLSRQFRKGAKRNFEIMAKWKRVKQISLNQL